MAMQVNDWCEWRDRFRMRVKGGTKEDVNYRDTPSCKTYHWKYNWEGLRLVFVNKPFTYNKIHNASLLLLLKLIIDREHRLGQLFYLGIFKTGHIYISQVLTHQDHRHNRPSLAGFVKQALHSFRISAFITASTGKLAKIIRRNINLSPG